MHQYMGKLAALAAVIWAISCLTGCAAPTGAESTEPEVAPTANQSFSASDLEVGYDETTATNITCLDTSAKISGSGAEISDGVITITRVVFMCCPAPFWGSSNPGGGARRCSWYWTVYPSPAKMVLRCGWSKLKR